MKNQIVFVRDTQTQRVEFMVKSESGKMRFESVLQSKAEKFTLLQAIKHAQRLNKSAQNGRYIGFVSLVYGYFTADN
jgi:hypothetical protein